MSKSLKIVIALIAVVLFIAAMTGSLGVLNAIIFPTIAGIVWYVLVIKNVPQITNV